MPTYMRFTENGLPVINGEVTAKGHENWIELWSCQMAVSQFLGSGMSEVVITKSADSTSMQLFNESVRLRPLTVEVDFVKPGEAAPYLTFTLQSTRISNFVLAKGEDVESLSLNFAKVTYNKHEASPDASHHLKRLPKGKPRKRHRR